MKHCPVCIVTEVEDSYTGLCPNPDCTWEFDFVNEMTPEVQKKYEEKLKRFKKHFIERKNKYNITDIDSKKALELIDSFISRMLIKTQRNIELVEHKIQKVEKGKSKFSENSYYRCLLSDGKGVIILHTDGKFASQTFYVRKGIGYYYNQNFEKTDSNLGLPISNEHACGSNGENSKTDFENGFIEWVANDNELYVYVQDNSEMRLFDKYSF